MVYGCYDLMLTQMISIETASNTSYMTELTPTHKAMSPTCSLNDCGCCA